MTSYDISRRRGDTKVIGFKLYADKAAGIPLNLTGYSFKLTVDPEQAPTTSANNLFSLTGIVDDPASGYVKFAPSVNDVNVEPGTYFYDIEITDPEGKTNTPILAKIKFSQDITK